MIKQRARDSKLHEYQELEQAQEIEQYNNPQYEGKPPSQQLYHTLNGNAKSSNQITPIQRLPQHQAKSSVGRSMDFAPNSLKIAAHKDHHPTLVVEDELYPTKQSLNKSTFLPQDQISKLSEDVNRDNVEYERYQARLRKANDR